MPIYSKSYKKAPVKILNSKNKKKFNLDEFLDRVIYSTLFRKLVPATLVVIGFGIVAYQVYPDIAYFLNSLNNKYNKEIISAIPEDYYQKKAELISSVQNGYFANVVKSVTNNSQVLGKEIDNISATYNGKFKLSIPSINLSDLPVQANVDSASEKVYKSVLEHNLAHFSGTPIVGMSGNVFIYGHSIQESAYVDDPKNPYVAFTKLFRMNIGEKINIERDGVTYSYTVFKIKEIAPTDLSVLEDTNDHILTLMTCSPPGNSTKRLIVVARQDNI